MWESLSRGTNLSAETVMKELKSPGQLKVREGDIQDFLGLLMKISPY